MNTRAEDMAERYGAGETLASIADSYGLTREGVRQILQKSGHVTAADSRAARQATGRQASESLRREALSFLETRPGLTLREAAERLNVDVRDLRESLAADAGRFLVRRPANEQRVFTQDDLVNALQKAAEHLGQVSLTTGQYDNVVDQIKGMPSGVRIVQRFGTWNQACEAAGLTPNHGRGNYSRRWSTEGMVACVAEYLELPGANGSFSEYDELAAEHGWPSGQTLRNALGSWGSAKSAALTFMYAQGRRP